MLTIGLCIALAAVYLIEQSLGADPGHPLTFDLRTAVAWGGVDRYLVLEEHEWWRLFTAPWLHGSVDHLIGNIITLAIAGAILERRIGAAWLGAIYFLGGIGGTIGSAALNQATLISVGASGAIMALVAAVFALSYHAGLERHGKKLRRLALIILVPALVPAAAHGGMQVDAGAHFGGAVTGIVLALILLANWPEITPAPNGRAIAGGVAACGAAMTAFTFVLVAMHSPVYEARAAQLVPISMLNDQETFQREAYALANRFPHDPAVRLELAVQSLHDRYYADMERHARAGLAEQEMLDTEFAPMLEPRLRIALSVSLLAQGQKDEAHQAAKPVCGAAEGAKLKELGLCD